MLWLAQVVMGTIVAVICFYLVKARYLVIHIIGWLIAAYFVVTYIQGFIISIRVIFTGVWSHAVTAGINILLAIGTVMCAFGGRAARIRQRQEERSFEEEDKA